MACLYTSLVRAKQELNGGVLPAMTPIPERLHAIFDPEFTIGMGALMEDDEKGLRCPVRGCGKYFHLLRLHLESAHADVGGDSGIRAALEIPPHPQTRLVSRRYSRRRSEIAVMMDLGAKYRSDPQQLRTANAERSKRAGAVAKKRRLVGLRNLTNSCEAQLIQRLLLLRDKIGRIPSSHEVALMGEQSLSHHVVRIYGSWDNFMAQVGLRMEYGPKTRRRYEREAVIAAYREWYEQHGYLPSLDTVHNARRTPKVPTDKVVKRAMGASTWDEAMEKLAAILGIAGGKYGWRRVHVHKLQSERAARRPRDSSGRFLPDRSEAAD